MSPTHLPAHPPPAAVLELLGSGPTGTSYRVHRPADWPALDRLGRPIGHATLKVLHRHPEGRTLTALHHAARVLPDCRHPALLAPRAFDPHEAWIYTPFVDGVSLHEVMALARHHREPVWAEAAVGIMREVATVLHRAHVFRDAADGVERDQVHPALHAKNIFLTPEGSVRVADWLAVETAPIPRAERRARLGPGADVPGIEGSIRSLGWLLAKLLTAGGRDDVTRLMPMHELVDHWSVLLRATSAMPAGPTIDQLMHLGHRPPIRDTVRACGAIEALATGTTTSRLDSYVQHLFDMQRIGWSGGRVRALGLPTEPAPPKVVERPTGPFGVFAPEPRPVSVQPAVPPPPEDDGFFAPTTFVPRPPSPGVPVQPAPVPMQAPPPPRTPLPWWPLALAAVLFAALGMGTLLAIYLARFAG